MNKYEILKDDFKEINGIKVYRIRALKNFADVKAGDLGGYVQDYHNLSQYDNCWVYDNAIVRDFASVRDFAVVRDKAIGGNSKIRKCVGNATVCDSREGYDN